MKRDRGFGGGPALFRIVMLGALVLAGCGGGVVTAGGGTGGTGISTGAVTGFGSVRIYEAEFATVNAVKMVNGMNSSAGHDNEVFRVGMIVTVKFDVSDNNATEVDYEDNLKGPAANISLADNTFTVFGQPVVVDNRTLFYGAGGMPLASLAGLADNNVVEVSGFADNAGRIRATLLERKAPMPGPGDVFEIKGFVRDASPADNTFRLSPLPTGPGTTALFDASGASLDGLAALDNGVYVEVKIDQAGAGLATIPARAIESKIHRTDLPAGIPVTIEGLVTRVASRTGAAVAFDLEGKGVQTDAATVFSGGGSAANIQPNARLQAEGVIAGGTVSASRIVFR